MSRILHSPRRTHKAVAQSSEDPWADEGGAASIVDSSLAAITEAPVAGKAEGNKEFRVGLSRLLAASQEYVDAGKEFARHSAVLADELETFTKGEWSVQHSGGLLLDVAKVIREGSLLQERRINAVRDALNVPIFQLFEVEGTELRHLADAKARAEEDLAMAAQKNARKKAERVKDVSPLESFVEQRQAEYDAQVAIVECAKKLKVFSFVQSLLNAQQDYYATGSKMMGDHALTLGNLEGKLKELEAAQEKSMCKDSYIWKLSHKTSKWKRVWLVLRNGWLEVRSMSESKKIQARGGKNRMNLLISTVKIPMRVPSAEGGEDKFAFEIVTPERKRPWTFGGRSEAERQSWIEILQASIGSLINNQRLSSHGPPVSDARGPSDGGKGMSMIRKVIAGPKGHRKTGSLTASAESARQMAMALLSEGGDTAVMAELSKIPGNDVCADCGKPDPDWASMNLGILVCLNCSGCHRHLGSHITKVRSLTMDKWPAATLRYMKCIGNQVANSFWEANLSGTVGQILDAAKPKPKPQSSVHERTEFIDAKYGARLFAPAPVDTDKAKLSEALFKAIAHVKVLLSEPGVRRRASSSVGEVGAVASENASPTLSRRSDLTPQEIRENIWPIYQILCWGPDLLAHEHGTGLTLLQAVLLKRDPFLLNFFLVHGVEVGKADPQSGDTVLHFIARHNLHESLEMIFQALQSASLLRVRNLASESPIDVARACNSEHTLQIFLSREQASPDGPPPIQGAGGGGGGGGVVDGGDARGGESPRKDSSSGIGAGADATSFEGGEGASGSVMKKLHNRFVEAQKGHMRSKSSISTSNLTRLSAPTAGAATTASEGTPGGLAPIPTGEAATEPGKKGIFRGRLSDLAGKRGTPLLTSKATFDGLDDKRLALDHEEEPSSPRPGGSGGSSSIEPDPQVTPFRRSLPQPLQRSDESPGIDLGTEVLVAGKRAPLLKAKGMQNKEAIQAAVSMARLTSMVVVDEPSERTIDLAALVDTSSDDDDDDNGVDTGELI